MTVLVEGCVGSLEESLAAEAGGASRLELCDNLDVGGTTPNRELALEVKRRVQIPAAMMVRPRGGSFVFTAAEIDETRRDLDRVLEYGADVVVLGLLASDGSIDVPHTRELAKRAGATPVTVHLAFDQVPDQLRALDTLVDLGVARVLTSGAEAPRSKARTNSSGSSITPTDASRSWRAARCAEGMSPRSCGAAVCAKCMRAASAIRAAFAISSTRSLGWGRIYRAEIRAKIERNGSFVRILVTAVSSHAMPRPGVVR